MKILHLVDTIFNFLHEDGTEYNVRFVRSGLHTHCVNVYESGEFFYYQPGFMGAPDKVSARNILEQAIYEKLRPTPISRIVKANKQQSAA